MRTAEFIMHDKTVCDDVPDHLMWKVLAYKVTTDNREQCSLRKSWGALVNPANMNLSELKQSGTDFQKVSTEHYNKYLDIIFDRTVATLKSLERKL